MNTSKSPTSVSGLSDSNTGLSGRSGNETLDQLDSSLQSTRERAESTVARMASQAEMLARRGVDAMRGGAGQVRERAVNMTDSTTRYVRDEPVKSMLIAAAAGAALMALLSLGSRRRH